MTTNKIIIETQYLPPLEFFCCLIHADDLLIESYEHYQKQTYRNKCYILGSNGVERLTVPVLKSNSKRLIKDLKICYEQKWNIQHWKTIKSVYGRASFFEFFESFFYICYEKPPKYLLDFNHNLLNIFFKLLNIDVSLIYTKHYCSHYDSLGIKDLRSTIISKTPFDKRFYYKPVPYYQPFGNEFVPNLSIIDLLMNEGSNTVDILKKSVYRKEL